MNDVYFYINFFKDKRWESKKAIRTLDYDNFEEFYDALTYEILEIYWDDSKAEVQVMYWEEDESPFIVDDNPMENMHEVNSFHTFTSESEFEDSTFLADVTKLVK